MPGSKRHRTLDHIDGVVNPLLTRTGVHASRAARWSISRTIKPKSVRFRTQSDHCLFHPTLPEWKRIASMMPRPHFASTPWCVQWFAATNRYDNGATAFRHIGQDLYATEQTIGVAFHMLLAKRNRRASRIRSGTASIVDPIACFAARPGCRSEHRTFFSKELSCRRTLFALGFSPS